MKKQFLIILTLPFMSFCNNAKQGNIVGTWEIDRMKITMNTFQNSDKDQVMEVTAKNWEQKMRTRNIQTTYNEDGTYHSVHRNLQDSIVYDPAGTWEIIGDTLVIQDTFPTRAEYKYRVKIDGDIAEFWGKEDFDQDGNIDDEYYSKQKRIR